mgnify:CR=1 FL=1
MVSVIIVSFNTRDLTRNCLASLRDKYSEAHVVVVDNASKDGSAEMVRSEFPDVELIAIDRNAGFGGANNLGYERCQSSDYVILLNLESIRKLRYPEIAEMPRVPCCRVSRSGFHLQWSARRCHRKCRHGKFTRLI